MTTTKLALDTLRLKTASGDQFDLTGRAIGIPVPYLTPVATPSVIAFDVFPKGTPTDFNPGIIGVAWIDLCSTDIVADGTNYECLRLQKFSSGVSAIGSAAGGTGTQRGLALQHLAGTVGVGTGTTLPSSLLTLNATSLPAIELQVSAVAKGYLAIVTGGGGSFFTGSVSGDIVLRGMGGKLLLGSKSTTPAPTLILDNTGFVGIGTGAVAPSSLLTLNAASIPGIELQVSATVKGNFAIATAGGQFTTDAVASDVVVRSRGGTIRFGVGSSTPASIMALTALGVGIGNDPAASAILDAASTTKGFLPPRMTTTQRDAISSPASGLVIYNTTTGKLNLRGASAWEAVTSA